MPDLNVFIFLGINLTKIILEISYLSKNDISGDLFTLNWVLILNYQYKEGARYVIFVLFGNILFFQFVKEKNKSRFLPKIMIEKILV